MKKVSHLIEFICVFILTKTIRFLPLPFVSMFAWLIATPLSYIPSGIQKKARKQIKRALPHLSEKERNTIARRSSVHMLQTFLETPRIYTMTPKQLTKRLTINNLEEITQKTSGFLLTAHFGNWEVLLRIMTLHNPSCAVIYRPANNPYVDRLIQNLRLKTNVTAIEKGKKGARKLVKACKQNAYIGILNDQKLREGKTLTLFGQPAKTATAFAELALKFNMPAVPFFARRTGFGKYTIDVLPELSYDKTQEDASVMLAQAYNDVLEDYIRQYPEQWMWQHRRFD